MRQQYLDSLAGRGAGPVLAKDAARGDSSRQGSTGSTALDLGKRLVPSSDDIQYDTDSDKDMDSVECESKFDKSVETESATTAPEIDIASAELKSLLLEHSRLKGLYPAAIVALGQKQFRNSMHYILGDYAKALKECAKEPQQLQSGDLVRRLSGSIASAIVAFHDPSVAADDAEFRWESLQRQKLGAAPYVEEWLSSQKETIKERERWQNTDGGDFYTDSEGEDLENSLPNLSKVAAFMTSGPAFDHLYASIRDLSKPGWGYIDDSPIRGEASGLHVEEIREQKPQDLRLKTVTGSSRANHRIKMLYSDYSTHWTYYQKYQEHLSEVKSQFWPKIPPNTSRLQWKCVRPAPFYFM